MGSELTPEQMAENPGLAWALRQLSEPFEICPRELPRFENMADACDYLGIDDSGHEPCPVVFPQFDIGHEEVVNIGGPFNGIPHLVYATIYKSRRESCRATAFPTWWREAE